MVPVKAFSAAKMRLSDALDHHERSRLAKQLAERVIRSVSHLETLVACDDAEVADWARQMGAGVSWTPGCDLDAAVGKTVALLAERKVARVVVAHSDLADPEGLAELAELDFSPNRVAGVVVVPDLRRDGTNVCSIPSGLGFGFGFGAGSFRRHCGEAHRLAAPLLVLANSALSLDVDTAWDLELARERWAMRPGRLGTAVGGTVQLGSSPAAR